MTIYVIRHADKEKGEFYTPPLVMNNQPISAEGRQQALDLLSYFRDVTIDSIFISRYIRTAQTIAPVAQEKKVKPIVDSRLDEINIGSLETLSEEEIERDYPDFWEPFHSRDRDFRFPNGETGDECGMRIHEVFSLLDPSKNHILVSHDGIIRVLICMVLGLPTFKRHLFRIDLCSITTFEYLEEFKCWAIPRINYTIGNCES